MGVKGLWTLVGPAARPTQLESLRQKRIAVDASIWIHQFMRTMRDSEGNALRNGHLLGFFRRICKLLFFDIKPVFVFDGGAPSLKKNTIKERRRRREGMKANLKATARKLLNAQVKSKILQQEQREKGSTNTDTMNTSVQFEPYYFKNKKFDQYELPEMTEFKNQSDPRLLSEKELYEFVHDFNPADADIDSDSFRALPIQTQYEIIQDLMWKSRSTSWARLDGMVRSSKTAMDFSKQQIKLLKHRNEMTQRLVHIGQDSKNETARVAGERGRQYVLYKNENLKEGLGWKLPGLSAAEPVYIDIESEKNRPEPKLEIPDKSAFPFIKESSKDKVAEAISTNPKLAALFAQFSSDEEEELVPIDLDQETEDEPLFMAGKKDRQENLVNDINAYADDDAIQDVISRIYQNNQNVVSTSPVTQEMNENLLELDADGFYEAWLSRAPDAFIYLHSFNDEYKRLLKRPIETYDLERISKDLLSTKKQYSKTNEVDELALEALEFQISFLNSVEKWKQRHPAQEFLFESDMEDDVFEEEEPVKIPEESNKVMILEDDDDEQDIEFIKVADVEIKGETIISDEEEVDIHWIISSSQKSDIIEPTAEDHSKATEHVHIDIHQSSLQRSEVEKNVNTKQKQKPSTDSLNEDKEGGMNSVGYIKKDTTNDLDTTQKTEDGKDGLKESIQNPLTIDEKDAFNKPTYVKIEDDLKIDNLESKEKETLSAKVNEIDDNLQENPAENTTETPAKDFGYNSEDELDDLQKEDDEFSRFMHDIASKNLDTIQKDVYEEMKQLNVQKKKDMANSDEITDQMIQDIQELLKLFGIPYLVSPMEAEAQCAELEILSLVDGTITDDSDAFLFGAGRVYKNMFSQQRYVECYRSQDIDREMLLSRKKLIQLAFLLGSDYTEGISGVGPVMAIEILAEFSSDDEDEDIKEPLLKFKDWYNSGIDETPFQKKFRKKHVDLEIPDDFPNPLVIDAYYHPTVDDSSQNFVWGEPQLDSLRIFLMEAFGWQEEKADQVLLPVLREMNKKAATGEQTTIGSYFNVSNTISSNGGNREQHRHSSKRVQNIVDKWKKQKKSK